MARRSRREWGRVVPGLLWVVSLLLLALSARADFYKWRDGGGQVHYTQIPPAETLPYPAERIATERLSAVRMMPHLREGRMYCGSLPLPPTQTEPVSTIFRLRQAVDQWRAQLQQGPGGIDSAGQLRMTELQCAIAYAIGELELLSDIEDRVLEDYRNTKDELESLEQELSACQQEQRGDSDACEQRYRAQINEQKGILKALAGPKRLLEQGW